MLKVLRDNLKSLHWVLWLVVGVMVLFVFAQWGGGGQISGTGMADSAAEVGGERITIGEFQRAYEQTETQYRQAFGEQFTEETARQLQLPLIVLGQLVDRQILLEEARRAGLRVTDEELRRAILEFPAFQDPDGDWAGEENYRQVLRASGYSVEGFQEALRADLLIDKLRTTVERSIFVPDAEVEKSYRRQRERASIRHVELTGADAEVEPPTEAEVAAYYEEHRESFRRPARRVVDYLLVDGAAIAESMEISEEEVRAWYEEHRAEFTTEEQVHARHILLRTGEERTVEEARSQLEELRARAQAGEDFATLAEEVSEDPGSAAQGGDLGWFGRAEMTSAFADAAFGAEPGELVIAETPFGVHLIEVLARRPGGAQPLAQVRDQIASRLRQERSQEEARSRAESLAEQLGDEASREEMRTLAEGSEQVRFASTEPFGREDHVPEIGRANAFTEAAFRTEPGQAAEPVQLPGGWAVLAVREEIPSDVPPLEEIRDRVREAAWRAARLDAAERRLAEARSRVEQGVSFDEAAAGLGVEPVDSGSFGADGPVGGLGEAPRVARRALTLDVGALGGPIRLDDRVVLFEVTDRVRFDPQEFAGAREALRRQLVSERAGRLLAARIAERRSRLEVEYNNRLLANFGVGPLAEDSGPESG